MTVRRNLCSQGVALHMYDSHASKAEDPLKGDSTCMRACDANPVKGMK